MLWVCLVAAESKGGEATYLSNNENAHEVQGSAHLIRANRSRIKLMAKLKRAHSGALQYKYWSIFILSIVRIKTIL